MSLLEKDTIKKKQVDENNIIKLDTGDNKSRKYKVKVICNNIVYAKESVGILLRLNYLVSWKSYLKKENI